MTPYYDDGTCVIYHGDCREILPTVDPVSVDLVLTDPPYGTATATDNAGRRGNTYERIVGDGHRQNPTVTGCDMEAVVDAITSRKSELGVTWSELASRSGLTTRSIGYIRERSRSSYRASTLSALSAALGWPRERLLEIAGAVPSHTLNEDAADVVHLLRFGRCVIWGGNYFADALPPSPSWFVWDKRSGVLANSNADCELAWSNVGGAARLFSHLWAGMLRASESGAYLHPTQKPVALMEWVLDRASEPGDLILDPYMGSGPVARAAANLGRRYIGVELEERYCEIAAKRLGQGVLDFGGAA